jgi:transcriptional regulator with XRE-family HTH domain
MSQRTFSEADRNVWGRAVGLVITRLRKERGLTMKSVAERVGCDRNYIWELEHEERIPRLDTLARLAEALGIGLAEFVAHIAAENNHLLRRSGRAE